MRDPLPRFGQVCGRVGEQSGEQLHASERVANLVCQYRRDLCQRQRLPRGFSLAGHPLLFCDISDDPDRVACPVCRLANVCSQNADSTIAGNPSDRGFLLAKKNRLPEAPRWPPQTWLATGSDFPAPNPPAPPEAAALPGL
jgi:hypothetical protein